LANSRTYRKKYKEIKSHQLLYFDYLTNNEEPLKMEFHLKLINEISRLSHEVKRLETFNVIEMQQPVAEWEIKMNSSLNKR